MLGKGDKAIVIAFSAQDVEEGTTDERRHRCTQLANMLVQSTAEGYFLCTHASKDLTLAQLGRAIGQGDLHLDAGALILEQRIQGLMRPLICCLHDRPLSSTNALQMRCF